VSPISAEIDGRREDRTYTPVLETLRLFLRPVILEDARANADDHRGFWIAEPYWRKGLMSEAVEAVNQFVFEYLSIDSFIEQNAANNAASWRLKESPAANSCATKKAIAEGREKFSGGDGLEMVDHRPRRQAVARATLLFDN
jgi:Acetyltransferase (GNAT) domain